MCFSAYDVLCVIMTAKWSVEFQALGLVNLRAVRALIMTAITNDKLLRRTLMIAGGQSSHVIRPADIG